MTRSGLAAFCLFAISASGAPTLVDVEDVDTESDCYPPVGDFYIDRGLAIEMGEAAESHTPGSWMIGPWAEDVSWHEISNKAMCPAKAATLLRHSASNQESP